MHAVLEAAGLVRGTALLGTAVWLVDLYRREMPRVPRQS